MYFTLIRTITIHIPLFLAAYRTPSHIFLTHYLYSSGCHLHAKRRGPIEIRLAVLYPKLSYLVQGLSLRTALNLYRPVFSLEAPDINKAA